MGFLRKLIDFFFAPAAYQETKRVDFEKFGVTEEMLKEVSWVAAFDLGHGESAVCCMETKGNARPQKMKLDGNDSDKVITGLFRTRPGEDWKLLSAGVQVSACQEAHIKFKDLPKALNRGAKEAGDAYPKKELLQAFVKQVLAAVKTFNEGIDLDPASFLVFVGCPSGEDWKKQEKEYAAIIREACPCPVVIMPESRAALFQVIFDQKDLGGGDMLEKGVLVVDFGSSTADWTYMYKNLSEGRVEVDEDSIKLGASILENLMLWQGMETQERKAKKERAERIRAMAESMEGIPALKDTPKEELLTQAEEAYPEEKLVLLPESLSQTVLSLRAIKEDYFTSEGELEQEVAYLTKDKRTGRFTVNREFMEGEEGVIYRKFSFKSEKGSSDVSWHELCFKLFEGIKKRLGDRPFETVILTGGASKMGFVKELCAKVFGEARIAVDTSPSTCVAKGMAYAGVMDIRARLAAPKVLEKVMEKMGSQGFVEGCGQEISKRFKETLYQEVVWPGFLEWKDLEGRHKPRELSSICRDKLKELQAQEDFQEKVKKAIQSGILSRKDQVIQVINSTYDEIYRRKIPENYRLKVDEEKLKKVAGEVIHCTFDQEFDDLIVGSLSFLGGKTGFLNTLNKRMPQKEREKRVNRITEERREPVIQGYCEEYLNKMTADLLKSEAAKGKLRECLGETVQVMIDDLSSYFA